MAAAPEAVAGCRVVAAEAGVVTTPVAGVDSDGAAWQLGDGLEVTVKFAGVARNAPCPIEQVVL
jgi:hypothetical protein